MAYKGRYDYYKHGDWNALCDICGHKRKASMMRLAYDNTYRCEMCYEDRHPQDFVKGVRDDQTTEWTRTDPSYDTTPITPAYPEQAGA